MDMRACSFLLSVVRDRSSPGIVDNVDAPISRSTRAQKGTHQINASRAALLFPHFPAAFLFWGCHWRKATLVVLLTFIIGYYFQFCSATWVAANKMAAMGPKYPKV